MLTIAQRLAVPLLTAAAIAAPASSGHALEQSKDEKDKLKVCERRVCEMIVKKAPADGDLTCSVAKTWARDSIKSNSESKKISWGFGDARCSVDLKVPRSLIIEALERPKMKAQLPLHTVTCEIEREKEVTSVEFTLGPKIQFENGHAKKIWVNLKHVKGPGAIKGLAVTVAKLEDSIGLFQKELTKAINKFMSERCKKVLAGD